MFPYVEKEWLNKRKKNQNSASSNVMPAREIKRQRFQFLTLIAAKNRSPENVIKNIARVHVFAVKSFSVVWINQTQRVCKIKIPPEIQITRFFISLFLHDTALSNGVYCKYRQEKASTDKILCRTFHFAAHLLLDFFYPYYIVVRHEEIFKIAAMIFDFIFKKHKNRI